MSIGRAHGATCSLRIASRSAAQHTLSQKHQYPRKSQFQCVSNCRSRGQSGFLVVSFSDSMFEGRTQNHRWRNTPNRITVWDYNHQSPLYYIPDTPPVLCHKSKVKSFAVSYLITVVSSELLGMPNRSRRVLNIESKISSNLFSKCIKYQNSRIYQTPMLSVMLLNAECVLMFPLKSEYQNHNEIYFVTIKSEWNEI